MSNKRKNYKGTNDAISDPLSDFNDSSFDIIQFLAADNATPVDSPVHQDASRTQRKTFPTHDVTSVPIGNHHMNSTNPSIHQDAMHQNYLHQPMNVAAHVMFQNNNRLLDSPPVTENSRHGSSVSPASNSDHRYSPDNYPNYNTAAGNTAHAQNYPHLTSLLSSNETQNGMMATQAEQIPMYPSHMQCEMPVHDSNCYLPMYPQDSTHLDVPEVHATQKAPNTSEHAYQNNQTNVAGSLLYQMLAGTAGNEDYNNSRKRARMEEDIEDMDVKNPYIVQHLETTQPMQGVNVNMQVDHNGVAFAMPGPIPPPPPSIVPSSGGPSPRHANTANMPSATLSHMNMNKSPEIQSGPNGFPKSGSKSPNSFTKDINLPHNPVIKFFKFEEEKWLPLCDMNYRELEKLQVHVVADKGFNYSSADQCFVNQKKNHFQVSVHIEAIDNLPPVYVKKDGQVLPIKQFKLVFCGVKAEMPSCEIQIKQSQNDRKPVNHDPVTIKIVERQMTKVTVPRLHFQDTTLNNQRKNYRPNPDQKYFLLIIRLMAYTEPNHAHLIQAYQSERVIVRATNPGSFEPPEIEAQWQRNASMLYTHNPVAIGADMSYQDAKLSVHGDIFHVGKTITASDRRLKEDFIEKDAKQALENMSKLHVVGYSYKPEMAEKWGLSDEQRKKTGLIAQELAEVLPDAVYNTGDFLAIDEGRVFYETLLATQELCRLTGDLDSKIDGKVEEISQRLARYARRKKLMSSGTLTGTDEDSKSVLSFSSDTSSVPMPKKTNSKKSKDEPSCYTKVTQGAVVFLVFIMTLCVLTMCGLYITDFYFRHSNKYGYSDDIEEAPGQMVLHSSGTITNGDLLIGHVCPHEYCHSYCCRANEPTGTRKSPFASSSFYDYDEYNQDVTSTESPVEEKEGKPFSYGVFIEIPTLNATIDSRYCEEDNCSPKRNTFNLRIPVSPYVPTTSFDIRFNIPDGFIVNGCGSTGANKICSDVSFLAHEGYPTLYRLNEIAFELSIGQYLESTYRFRVGHSTESCSMEESRMKGNYDEYNLHFYRSCTSATNELQ